MITKYRNIKNIWLSNKLNTKDLSSTAEFWMKPYDNYRHKL